MKDNGTFSSCEFLIRKYAPLFMRVGEFEEHKRVGLMPRYRPPVDDATIERMKQMRQEGFTIGVIARTCRVSWRTAWLRSK